METKLYCVSRFGHGSLKFASFDSSFSVFFLLLSSCPFLLLNGYPLCGPCGRCEPCGLCGLVEVVGLVVVVVEVGHGLGFGRWVGNLKWYKY